MSFDETKHALALNDLRKREGIDAGLLLSTCNRVEVYVYGDVARIIESCRQFYRHWQPSSANVIDRYLFAKSGNQAIEHLFKVTSSIDSMVPGEPQVLGQVKKTYRILDAIDWHHPTMNRIVRKSFSVAKRVRQETAISKQAVSIAYVAVELARKIFSDLCSSKVLLVGAGEMAELVAKHLMSRGIEELIICNRNLENAIELANPLFCIGNFAYAFKPIPSKSRYCRFFDEC